MTIGQILKSAGQSLALFVSALKIGKQLSETERLKYENDILQKRLQIAARRSLSWSDLLLWLKSQGGDESTVSSPRT